MAIDERFVPGSWKGSLGVKPEQVVESFVGFEVALVEARRAGGDPRARDCAIGRAVAIAGRYAEDVNQEGIFTPRLREIEVRTGRPIEIVREAQLPTAARVEVAEYRGRSAHVLRYRTDAPAYGHLVMHELEHLEMIADARDAGVNSVFTSAPEHRDAFLRAFQPKLDKMVRSGIPAERVAAAAASVFEGMNSQVYNTPLDMFVESRLYSRSAELRPLQFLSLYRLIKDGIRAATSRNMSEVMPSFVRDANTVYNLVQARQFADLFGIDYTAEFKASSQRWRADRLYAEFLHERDHHRPGGEYELVERWAHILKLARYFCLIPEKDLYLPL